MKTGIAGIDFVHYGLKSGMVFKGTTTAYKRICLFNSKCRKREREITGGIQSFELNFNKYFVGVLT